MALAIRFAVPADAPELARLRWDFRADEHDRQSRSEFMAECTVWLDAAMNSERWLVIVAAAQGAPGRADNLVGCMYLQLVEKVPIPGAIHRAWGYVTNVYVEADWRSQGIGGQMLDLLTAAGREQALEFLIVWPSEEAVPFYRRAGFRPAAEIHARPDDYPPLELEIKSTQVDML